MNEAVEKQRKALGKGLSALLPGRGASQGAAAAAAVTAPGLTRTPTTLPIDAIHPNPMQPRVVFQPDRLEELATSIRANGIIQPLIVRHHQGQYQLIAGERRWRASKLAGLKDVPVVIQEIADPLLLELALIENIQREDLNAIETAHAYERLGRELGLSQEEIGRRTGKDRTSITNALRLLKLPTEVQLLLAEHRLSMGHARAVLGLPTAEQQIEVAEKAAAQGLSVRQVEALVQDLTSDRPRTGHKKEAVIDPNVKAAVDELERALGTRVRIVELSEQRGRIEIEYYSQVELDRLFQQITGRN
ncbi:MAG TPA: ParB/RepB/Spo0J family partition protein [Bryobacteraceae bacterium]|nr:ParB/RepB/Spo0J family partition protein [Bryobacteraceae bacterium]